jgi:hypothetical protein
VIATLRGPQSITARSTLQSPFRTVVARLRSGAPCAVPCRRATADDNGVSTARDTQEAARALPHELIYEQAMRRIATLSEAWRDAVEGVVGPAPATLPAVPAARSGTLPAVITPIGLGMDADTEAQAVAARVEAPRWRRSLVS